MFSPEKILNFEKLDVPVDFYAMGSSLFANEWGREWNIFHQISQVKINVVYPAMSKARMNPRYDLSFGAGFLGFT